MVLKTILKLKHAPENKVKALKNLERARSQYPQNGISVNPGDAIAIGGQEPNRGKLTVR